jgi:hypothetical protein
MRKKDVKVFTTVQISVVPFDNLTSVQNSFEEAGDRRWPLLRLMPYCQ